MKNPSISRRRFLWSATAATGVSPRLFAQTAFNEKITKVHVAFKTHLDIGFTNLAAKVIETYLSKFIPQSIKLAEAMRRKHPKYRFTWTTGSWLIYKYLEEADDSNRRRMEQAIAAGDICWHGLPFTLHSEVLDASLFNLGTKLSAILDKRFGKTTIAAKMTDVPGHTRGIVPLLQNAGIKFLHIGVNPASSPPDIPPVFVWRAPDGSSVKIMYQKDYGGIMHIPHSSEAVAIILTGDNHGPQKEEDIVNVYNLLKKQFPGAKVAASDLNVIANSIENVSSNLPVITSELGDSWIHGVGSDPKKIAQLRELSRLRKTWIQCGSLKEGSAQDLAFGIPLTMIAEHTWGLDIKTHLQSWDIYTPEDLRAARTTNKFKFIESSWQEKRGYIQDAVRSLPGDMNQQAKKALYSLKPNPPQLDGFDKISNLGRSIQTTQFSIALDPVTGALNQLQNLKTGRQWASDDHPLALLAYQSFAQSDYERFMKQYLTAQPNWALQDFGKPGLEKFKPLSQTYLPRLKSAWSREYEKTYSIITELEMLDNKGKAVLGCPQRLTTEYLISKKEPVLQITFQWFDKQANRLPEAWWLSFTPRVDKEGNWVMDKMGQEVDPRDVVMNGGHKLHAVTKGVRYHDSRSNMTIKSPDAPLVAPGERTLLNFDNARPSPDDGMHFCLCNNVWGTNFVMWFDGDMRFRFEIRV